MTSSDSHAEDTGVDLKHFRRVPLTELTTPADGRIVYTNRYWMVTADDEALFYCGANRRANSPQCNHNRSIVEQLMRHEGCKVVFVPVAYLKHSCNDYVY